MSSPLFRWKFDSPKRPIQRTDSEETFFEEVEKNEVKEPCFQYEDLDMDTKECSQFPTQQSFFGLDGFAEEAPSQGGLTSSVPVPGSSTPSGDLSSSNLDFPVQNNPEKVRFFHDKQKDDFGTQNSQDQKWTNESLTTASRHTKRLMVSSDETFFEEDKLCAVPTGENNCSRSLLREAARKSTGMYNTQDNVEIPQEILTGLNDTQFNAYRTDNCICMVSSTDATFVEERKVEQVDIKYRVQPLLTLKTSAYNAPDVEMSAEILTGLNDSQFNAYPTDLNCTAPSTDATLFDLAENKLYTVESQLRQKVGGHNMANDVTEFSKSSISVFERESLNKNAGLSGAPCVFPVLGADSNHELSQDIIELIEGMPEYSVFDFTNLNDIIRMLECPTDPVDFVELSPTSGRHVEIVNLTSSFQSSPTKDNRQTSSNEVANKQKRVLSPLNVGEGNKRRRNDLKSAQQVRSIGKPPLAFIKKAKTMPVPVTPCHSMSLRVKKERSTESPPKCPTRVSSHDKMSGQKCSRLDLGYLGPGERVLEKEPSYQTKISTPKSSSSPTKSEKKKLSRGKKNASFYPDYIGANPRTENTPGRTSKRFGMQTLQSEVLAKKQEKNPPSPLKVTFKGIASTQTKGKRGRPKRTECTPKITEVFNSQRRTSPRVNKLNAETPRELFRGLSDDDAVVHFDAQMSRDETCLRNIRKRLLDVIFDDATITNKDAEKMSRKIKEKQQRICMWSQSDVGGKKVKELEALCDTLLHQIKTISADVSCGERKVLPVPVAKHVVPERNDAVSPCPHPEGGFDVFSGRSLPKKDKFESKKFNLSETVPNRRPTKQTTRAKQAVTTAIDHRESSYCGQENRLASPGIDCMSHPPPDIQLPGPSPGQIPENISMRSLEKQEVVMNKSNLDGVVANLYETKKNTPAKHATNNQTRKCTGFSRKVLRGVCSVQSPRCPPVKLMSGPDLRADTLTEQFFSRRIRKNDWNSGPVPIAERSLTDVGVSAVACGASSTKACVDVGTNMDFVAPNNKREEKILIDRSTNTDSEDRGEKRKVLVDCGTNTDFFRNLDLTSDSQVGRNLLSSANKENIETKLDFKGITRVWLPRPEDFLPCSFDQLSPEFFGIANAELPCELLDDLTWED